MINNKVIKLLEELENTRGRNAKIKIIEDNEDTTDFIPYLKAALNPYEIYNIGKMVKPVGFSQTEEFGNMFEMTKFLSQKKGLNNQDLFNIFSAIEKLDSVTQKWIKKAILKKSIAGIGAKTINKALGYDAVPVFELMLVHNNEKDYKGIKFPIMAQVKIDGFRCIKFPGKIFLGRSGKPIANSRFNEHVQIDDNLKFKEDPVVLDGEAYSHERDFNSIASILSSEDKEIPEDIKFVVFSAIPLSEWLAQEGKTTYIEQYNFINTYDWENICENVVPIRNTKIVNSIEELEAYYKEVTDLGYEGVIVKNPNEPYYWKRVSVNSGIMQKIKPDETTDAKIIDYFEGEGDFKGMLGGFVTELESGVKVRVGSGLKLKERKEIWKDVDQCVNMWVEIKYMHVTPDGSLRHPIFKRFRDSKE